MRLETPFIRTFVLNCTKLRTSSNSHPCHPRDGDDCLSAIFFLHLFCLKKRLYSGKKAGRKEAEWQFLHKSVKIYAL